MTTLISTAPPVGTLAESITVVAGNDRTILVLLAQENSADKITTPPTFDSAALTFIDNAVL